jgi:DNA helicase-2/ATP-dependent DNA helicase PcrA
MLFSMGGLKFSDEHLKFLAHNPKRSARLVAGPGAGKSTICVAYLAKHTDPTNIESPRIRMLTFTRAATAELAEKMRARGLAGDIPPPSTLHSFALRILRQLAWPAIPQPVRLADDWETDNLIRPQLSRFLKAQGHGIATPTVVEALELEMAAGFESLDDETFRFQSDPALGQAYLGLWAQHRKRLGYLLIGEPPYRAGEAIVDMEVPPLDLDLLLVDEYQDLNKADIRLVKLLADSGIAVIAIGDEDQSIYKFRKAAPEGIRNFLSDFGAKDDYRLTKSIRCGRVILQSAQRLIDAAPGRQRQPPMEAAPGQKLGVSVYLSFENDGLEAVGIANIVEHRINAGVSKRDIAILVRSRIAAWISELRPAFAARGIEIASDAWVKEALSDRNLRRTRAIANLVISPGDPLSWMTLLKLTHGISDAVIDTICNATKADETFTDALMRVCDDGLESLKNAPFLTIARSNSIPCDRRIPPVLFFFGRKVQKVQTENAYSHARVPLGARSHSKRHRENPWPLGILHRSPRTRSAKAGPGRHRTSRPLL